MKPSVKKTGRPARYEKREELVHVTFRADAETLDAIKALTEAARAPGVPAPRSVAIRRALIDAHARLKTNA